MKLTKGIITRDEAMKISADYVTYIEGRLAGEGKFDIMFDAFDKLKRGQKAITFIDGQFVEVKVTDKVYRR